MVLLVVLFGAGFLALVLFPQYWVKQQMQKNSDHRPDFPGTGGELAQHLVEHYGLHDVGVEETDRGDHFDPDEKMIRLTKGNFEGKSLTAVVIAAHEFGHALQLHEGSGGLSRRQKLVKIAEKTEKFGVIFFVIAPFLGALTRIPAAFLLVILIGILLLAVRIAVHVVTLPVEFDASFAKALPILEDGGYLKSDDLPAARTVLKAAALTYVAGAIMSLIDLARWVRVLR